MRSGVFKTWDSLAHLLPVVRALKWPRPQVQRAEETQSVGAARLVLVGASSCVLLFIFTCEEEEDGCCDVCDVLQVFFKDPSCSHLKQSVFSFSQNAVLRDVYSSHLRTQLMPQSLRACSQLQRVSSESQLRSDQFARHIWAKFGLTNFMKRRADWQEVHTGESKKRKMFSDVLQ